MAFIYQGKYEQEMWKKTLSKLLLSDLTTIKENEGAMRMIMTALEVFKIENND